MNYPPKSNIPSYFASIMVVVNFCKVTCGSLLVQKLDPFSTRFTLKDRKPYGFIILMHQMIGDMSIFRSITDYLIVSHFDSGLSDAKHGIVGNRYKKFFESIGYRDPLFFCIFKCYIFGFTH
jgi:hypothetical protein